MGIMMPLHGVGRGSESPSVWWLILELEEVVKSTRYLIGYIGSLYLLHGSFGNLF